MKPFRIFIFFTSVLLLLALIAYFMPEQGIGINGDFRFRFVSLEELFQEEERNQDEVVERLLAASSVTEDPEADPVQLRRDQPDAISGPRPDGPETPGYDSSRMSDPAPSVENSGDQPGDRGVPSVPRDATAGDAPPRVTTTGDPAPRGTTPGDAAPRTGNGRQVSGNLSGTTESVYAPANPDSLQNVLHRLQFPEGYEDLLNPFFRKLDQLKAGYTMRTRILHFGDSQIENDRMTALIRYRLQRSFGGTGTGLVQAIPLYSGSLSYQQEEAGGWMRYTYFRDRDSTISHNDYGIMAAFASVPETSGGDWPMLHYQFNLARRSGRCDRVRIFMYSSADSASLVFQVNDTITDTLRNIPEGYNMAEYRHVGIVRDLRLYLGFPRGGRIYGISFESFSGLQMDNIAMRGSSGLIFSQMNREQQQMMMDQLSPGLIMLQYGGNVVPYMSPRYYRRAFAQELRFLKEICPGVPVIVIGPADMSVREKGVFKTYPGLERIRDALKTATLETGFAFWDLYEAMGGYNSMPSFVHADPPLASTDYVHFNGLGINLVAEMFYNALMVEYRDYENQNSNP